MTCAKVVRLVLAIVVVAALRAKGQYRHQFAAASSSKECLKEKRELERFNPRFKIKPGTVSCHSLKRTASKCGGFSFVPSNFSDAVYYGSTGSHYTLLHSQQGSRCTYRANEQCTWRFALPKTRDAQVAFWKVEIEHSARCQHDYIVIDVIIDLKESKGAPPPNCVPLRGKGKRYKSAKLCRIEYKLPCGAYCDPVLSADKCWSTFTCPSSHPLAQKKTDIADFLSFNFSTADREELRNLSVKFIHVTFRADMTRQGRGFEGIYFTHEKRWRGKASLYGDENSGDDESNFLEGLGKIAIEKGNEVQKYNSTDLLISLSRASQDVSFFEKLKKHEVFSHFVKNQQHGVPLTMEPEIVATTPSPIRRLPATEWSNNLER